MFCVDVCLCLIWCVLLACVRCHIGLFDVRLYLMLWCLCCVCFICSMSCVDFCLCVSSCCLFVCLYVIDVVCVDGLFVFEFSLFVFVLLCVRCVRLICACVVLMHSTFGCLCLFVFEFVLCVCFMCSMLLCVFCSWLFFYSFVCCDALVIVVCLLFTFVCV